MHRLGDAVSGMFRGRRHEEEDDSDRIEIRAPWRDGPDVQDDDQDDVEDQVDEEVHEERPSVWGRFFDGYLRVAGHVGDEVRGTGPYGQALREPFDGMGEVVSTTKSSWYERMLDRWDRREGIESVDEEPTEYPVEEITEDHTDPSAWASAVQQFLDDQWLAEESQAQPYQPSAAAAGVTTGGNDMFGIELSAGQFDPANPDETKQFLSNLANAAEVDNVFQQWAEKAEDLPYAPNLAEGFRAVAALQQQQKAIIESLPAEFVSANSGDLENYESRQASDRTGHFNV